MIKRALTLLTSTIMTTACLGSVNNPKVIYGEDNRKDIFETTNETHRILAKSTAAMIPSSQVKVTVGSDLVQIIGKTLQKSVNICSTENYASQLTAANCTGFMVSEIHLVTAGHCITGNTDCAASKWVFDYSYETEPILGKANFFIDQSKVYSCRRIIERSQGNGTKDFAVIELNRPVLDRNPLKVRTSGTITAGTPLVVIGHPTGLPTKIADGGIVESVSSIEFLANLDTYGGNSGSPVFNDITGEVEGILVRGAEDYIPSRSKGCLVSNKCRKIDGTTKCKGESVTKITVIKSMDPNNRPPTDTEIQAYIISEPNLIIDFVNSKYKGCYLRNSHQLYNQLYVQDQFRGNFRKQSDDIILKSYLAAYVLDGTCVKEASVPSGPRSTPPMTLPPEPMPTRKPVPTIDPTPVLIPLPEVKPEPEPATVPEVRPIDVVSDSILIQDFIGGKYNNCYVRTNVRIYNQLYVNNRFVQNFVMERDDHLLAEKLRKYISDKACVPEIRP